MQSFIRLRTVLAATTALAAASGGIAQAQTASQAASSTPSMRNVELTGPYLHDGSATTLDAAIRRHVVPAATALEASQRADLIAFLDSLTDRRFVSDPRLALPPTACDRTS